MKGFCLRLTLAALASTLVLSIPTESEALGRRCRHNCSPSQQPQKPQPQPQPKPSRPETPSSGGVLPRKPELRQCRLLPRLFGRNQITNGFEEKVGNGMARILNGVQQANALFGTCRFFPTSARNACCKKFQSSALDKCTQDVANKGGSDCNSQQLGPRCCASLTAQAKQQLTEFCAQAVAQVSNGCEVPETPIPETPIPEQTTPPEDLGMPIVSLPSNSDGPSDSSTIRDPEGTPTTE
jgi:hypothetical protein